MTNGEFFQRICDAVSTSEAHVDLVGLFRRAKEFQGALERYLEQHEKSELAETLRPDLAIRLTAQEQEDYLDQMEDEIDTWHANALSDVKGFHWALSVFATTVESQLYGRFDVAEETDEPLCVAG